MTQMTQSRGIPLGARSVRLGHLGHTKNNDPNDPNDHGHQRQLAIKNNDPNDPNDPMAARPAGASLQHATRGTMAARPAGMRPLAIPTMPVGVPVGPAAKGRQKRTDREQFFLATKFFFL